MTSLSKMSIKLLRQVHYQLQGDFFRSALLSFLARFGSVIGSYISLSISSRMLSLSQFGVLSFALSIQALLSTIIELGITPAVIHYSSYYIGSNKPERVYSIYKLSLMLKIILNALLLIIGIIFAEIIAIELYRDSALIIPLIGGFILAILVNFQSYFIGILRSGYKFDLVAIAFMVQHTTQIIILVIIWQFVQVTIALVIVSYTIGLLSFILFCCFYYPWRSVIISPLILDRQQLGIYWDFVKWIALGYITSAFMLQINVPMIQYFHSSQEVARYYSAFKVIQIFWIAESVLGFVLLPKLSQIAGRHGTIGVRRVIPRLLVGVIGFCAFLATFVSIFARILLEVVFGVNYSSSISILYLLIPVGVCYFLYNSGGIVLLSLGRPDVGAKLGLLAVVINVVAGVILIPSLGSTGAAISAQVIFLIQAIVIWCIAWKLLRGSA
jgi:O-antigen/teichoic acid export membrane protein